MQKKQNRVGGNKLICVYSELPSLKLNIIKASFIVHIHLYC